MQWYFYVNSNPFFILNCYSKYRLYRVVLWCWALFVAEPNVYNLRTRLTALHLLSVILPLHRTDEPAFHKKVCFRLPHDKRRNDSLLPLDNGVLDTFLIRINFIKPFLKNHSFIIIVSLKGSTAGRRPPSWCTTSLCSLLLPPSCHHNTLLCPSSSMLLVFPFFFYLLGPI